MVFPLFPNNLFFFFSFLVNVPILNPTTELVIPTGTPTNEANSEIETHPLEAEIKTENDQSSLKLCIIFYAVHSLNHYVLFLQRYNVLFYLFFNSFVRFVFKVLI